MTEDIVVFISVLGSLASIVSAYIAVRSYMRNKKDNHPDQR